MSTPSKKRKLTPEQLESYAVLRDLRSELMDSVKLLNKMLKSDRQELEHHLEVFDGDPRVRASDGTTPVDGMYKLPMALSAKTGIKTLLESIVTLDQRLEVFEGTEEPELEEPKKEDSESAKNKLPGVSAENIREVKKGLKFTEALFPSSPGEGE